MGDKLKKAAEKEKVKRLIILNKSVYTSLQLIAEKNSLGTVTLIRRLLTKYVDNYNNSVVLKKNEAIPVKKKAREIPSTLKEVRPGRFEDSEGNQYVENSKGFMVAYDEDDDPDVVDI
jgi:predicted DNA-binding ribbon-helix-helix protein